MRQRRLIVWVLTACAWLTAAGAAPAGAGFHRSYYRTWYASPYRAYGSYDRPWYGSPDAYSLYQPRYYGPRHYGAYDAWPRYYRHTEVDPWLCPGIGPDPLGPGPFIGPAYGGRYYW